MPAKSNLTSLQLDQLAQQLTQWAKQLGFQQLGITGVDLHDEEAKLQAWLDAGYHGEMGYMANHGMMRARPAELHPGTLRVISVSMSYLPPEAGFASNLSDPQLAYISRYAGGRDYHKLIRNRLKKLGEMLNEAVVALGGESVNFRPFVDSAPILERPLAERAGLGWTGKHSLLLNQQGSWFFLGELLVDIPLPQDKPQAEQCKQCVACIKSCPTSAIVAPYTVDARRCISYLTIELQGSIPEEFRPLIGNRIYGCDDCQLVCPFNGDSQLTQENDFHTRSELSQPELLNLFAWTEAEFLKRTEGSAIRRIGYQRWLRNIAVALGNAPTSAQVISALHAKKSLIEDDMVIEHIDWALAQQATTSEITTPRKTQRIIRTVQKGMPRDA
ncbi:tRNA epoxyqueuosine(34) reductase QueG [Shewanella marina]|uniref:tRNA epoxyqueuosine(34) reductase QueG n=1 Tax=Shewanella marina TaxID=487319 RepID=UPI000B0CE6E7|nr:tRNA epoxyqueuosine(34) reductase QueG [Shewanella marina]